MTHDDEKAIEEMNKLSDNAKMYLSHVVLNSILTIQGHLEGQRYEYIPSTVRYLENELKRMVGGEDGILFKLLKDGRFSEGDL